MKHDGLKLSMLERLALRWNTNKDAYKHSRDSRQQARARSRRIAMKDVNQRFGLEPRKARRGIAMTWAKTINRQEVIKVIKT